MTRHHTADEGRPVVLLADDDEDLRSVLGEVLEEAGYATLLAATGPDAIARAGQQLLDAAMVDLHLPGANGQDVAAALRAGQPGLPVVLLTGDAAAQAPEGTRVLLKPVGLDELLDCLRETLDARAQVDAARAVKAPGHA